MAFLLSIYLVFHLCIGLLLPYRRGMKPYFFMLMENAGLGLERRLNRETRPQSVRFIRGLVVGLVMGLAGCLMGYVVTRAAQVPYGGVVDIVLLSLCVTVMMPLKLVPRSMGFLLMWCL